MSVDDREGWLAALEEMEEQVLRVERGEDVPAWQRPAGVGPLPPEFEQRARLLLERQRTAADRLRERLHETAQHLSAVRSVPAARAAKALYLDVSG